MTFLDYARDQAGTSLGTLVAQVSDAAHKELDSLRASFDLRITALETALVLPDANGALDRLVADLMQAANGQAEAAAAEARLDAQATARAELDAAAAVFQEQLDAERATNAETIRALADTRAQLDAALARSAASQQALDEARAQAEASQADAQADIQATRAHFEERLREAEVIRAVVAAELNDARREMAGLRDEAQAQAAGLNAAQAHVQALEHARAHADRARTAAETRLEAEALNRKALTETLEAVQAEVRIAQAETNACRNELHEAAMHIRDLEENRIGGEAGVPSHVVGHDLAQFDRVKVALEALGVATSPRHVLETLVTHLGHEFNRVALFVVSRDRLVGLCGRGFGATVDVTKMRMPLAGESLLARAAAEKKPAQFTAREDGPKIGLVGDAIDAALAFPVLANGQTCAVVYVEDTVARAQPAAALARAVGEIFVEQSSRRLAAKRPLSAAPVRDADQEGGRQVETEPHRTRQGRSAKSAHTPAEDERERGITPAPQTENREVPTS